MSILFIGKRFYTNRDTYSEKFGRIYQLPYHWSKKTKTKLWLIDYHTKEKIEDTDDQLKVSSTAIFSFSFIFKLISIIIFERPKTIVASGDCYIGLLGLILSKICFSQFIFDVYDKYNTFSGYKNFLGFNCYNFLLKKSDICLFASNKLKNDSTSLCKKTILIPNGIDINHFFPRDINTSRINFNLNKENIYIGYFGSMEEERGIDDLIEAVKLVRQQNTNVYILLGGKKRENLNLNYKFINYLGNIPFSKVPIAMACCDLLALPYRSSEFLNNASSCKIAEYIAMRVPIVATLSSNITQNFNLSEHATLNDFALVNNIESLYKTINHQIKERKILLNPSNKYQWSEISKKLFT